MRAAASDTLTYASLYLVTKGMSDEKSSTLASLRLRYSKGGNSTSVRSESATKVIT